MQSGEEFPVVGIGASAGGLDAFEELFGALPADTGMAFLVVTHQAPGHPSALPEILQRLTRMRVRAAKDAEPVEPNRVYVCPPDFLLTLADERLRLHPRSGESVQRPIDVLLASLAEARGEKAVAILLSGGNSDGTLGAKAVKEKGGLTFAQGGEDGKAPAYRMMPDSAIAAGIVDVVAPAQAIARRLAEFAPQLSAHPPESSEELDLAPVIDILRRQMGHDFSGYKTSTLQRRVRRRMQILTLDEPAAYVQRLKADRDEASRLFRDLLIGVTDFFRDSAAFAELEKAVIPKLFEGKDASESVRVWVPGCATGEEAYSLAILLRERADELRGAPKIQLFATDIDEAALGVARAGRFPASLLGKLSPERRKQFFDGDGSILAVSRDIRDICVFTPHSLIRDPPFSRIDMISCRNLLIYLGGDFQSRVIPVFHFALRPRGYLFLGTSENVSRHSDLFAPVDAKHRIFQRRDNVASPLKLPLPARERLGEAGSTFAKERSGIVNADLRRAVERRVLERFAPAHVLVNAEGNVLHFSAHTGKYLEPAPGQPNRQLEAMARPGLRLEVRTALQEARETRRRVTRRRIEVEIDDRVQAIRLDVEPIGGNDADPLFLVVFEDMAAPAAAYETGSRTADSDEAKEARLERDLRETHENLQASIEDYETALEDLKSSNEELQSANEELQSANEELETSREELQSINEEFQTINAELNAKIEELDLANGDLRNLFESTQIGTVFLDRNLVIRSFTPPATAIFNLLPADRGRPLTDIANHLDNGDLSGEIARVLETGETIERRTRRTDGSAHYLMRLIPYRSRSDAVEGLLVTFFDVSTMVAAEGRLRTLIEELNHRVRNMLTVVNAIATQTLSKNGADPALTKEFTGRIQAMGRSYSLVSRENWGDVLLADIIAGQIAPYRKPGADDRIEIAGPAVLCRPNAALSLGLIVHELGTNAMKLGSLSRPDGRLSVNWDVDGPAHDTLVIRWRERGGLARVPELKGQGFGWTLIDRELKGALGATAARDFSPMGLEATISIPLSFGSVVVCGQAA